MLLRGLFCVLKLCYHLMIMFAQQFPYQTNSCFLEKKSDLWMSNTTNGVVKDKADGQSNGNGKPTE